MFLQSLFQGLVTFLVEKEWKKDLVSKRDRFAGRVTFFGNVMQKRSQKKRQRRSDSEG
jgi:hypothetical protein